MHAADLLTAQKAGCLLGANPRRQVIGQLFCVVAGSLVIVPLFNLLVPTPDVLGGKDFPAPSAMVWKNVSEMLVKGIKALLRCRVGVIQVDAWLSDVRTSRRRRRTVR